MAKVRSRFRSSGIPAIAVLFICSAVLRFASGPGPAVAQTALGEQPERAVFASEIPECTDPQHIRDLLADLRVREDRIERMEAALQDRAQALNVAEGHIRAKLEELIGAEQQLAATMSRAETAAEEDLVQLTSVYENMKPADAIPLFEAMDPDFAAGFLARMRSDSAAAIMSGLTPESAYSVSVILAGRNANVPTD